MLIDAIFDFLYLVVEVVLLRRDDRRRERGDLSWWRKARRECPGACAEG
jgi:hypothetical protein